MTTGENMPSPPAQETMTAAIPSPVSTSAGEQRQPERVEVLREAASLISGDRERDYGPPAKNFATIAGMWSQILGIEVTPSQVALCMMQLKVARLINGGGAKRDSYVDAAAYSALAYELSDH